jgi:hypothetical protein
MILTVSCWTGAAMRTTLTNMTTHDGLLSSGPDERLTPWIIHDLPRIAWIVEYRALELTDEERQVVRDAITRMLGALEHDTA